MEVLKQEADNTDPAYWEKLLRYIIGGKIEDLGGKINRGKENGGK